VALQKGVRCIRSDALRSARAATDIHEIAA
jgi:hypothetical protein